MFHYNAERTGFTLSDAPETNNVRWTYTTEGPIFWGSAAVADGYVLFTSYDMKIHCVDQKTGEKIWKHSLHDHYLYSSPAINQGKVYVGGATDGWFPGVFCLYLNNGTDCWVRDLEDVAGLWSAVVVTNGRVYIGADGYGAAHVYCLDASNGSIIWNYVSELGNDNVAWSSPAVAHDRLYIGLSHGDGSGSVLCLNALNGSKIWRSPTDGYVYSTPAVVDGKVYAASSKYGKFLGVVYCFDANDGTPTWTYETSDDIRSSPAIANGKLYIGSDDGFFYCLDANTGTLLWSYETGGEVRSSPAVADGKVYFGSTDGNVYCLDAETGTYIWEFFTGDDPMFPPWVRTSPAIVDGVLYIGSDNGILFALEDTIEILDVKGGIGISATIHNSGTRDLVDITWHVSIKGLRFLKFINIEKEGILPPLEVGDSTFIKTLMFGIGKVQVTIEAYPPGVSPINVTKTGFQLGYYLLLKE